MHASYGNVCVTIGLKEKAVGTWKIPAAYRKISENICFQMNIKLR